MQSDLLIASPLVPHFVIIRSQVAETSNTSIGCLCPQDRLSSKEIHLIEIILYTFVMSYSHSGYFSSVIINIQN